MTKFRERGLILFVVKRSLEFNRGLLHSNPSFGAKDYRGIIWIVSVYLNVALVDLNIQRKIFY